MRIVGAFGFTVPRFFLPHFRVIDSHVESNYTVGVVKGCVNWLASLFPFLFVCEQNARSARGKKKKKIDNNNNQKGQMR